MTDPDWQNVKEIFLAALDRDESDLGTYLDSACDGNSATRYKVESLLESHLAAEDFIETPAFSTGRVFEDINGRIDQRFGAYTIVHEIGHGGMGTVYLARRTDGEFEQQVALKIVRQSIADSHMVERFKIERQILASLNHPNIAKLLDGGVSNIGEPFLAMEYIEGETITDFANSQTLSLDQKLRLFMKVCLAVAFAHRNLVVHRDIKPANILVTDNGEPKLLDFGLAKLSEPSTAAGGFEQTQTAFRALTPAYASPEQLAGKPISTSSDVYSLGVVMYELLTGKKPFEFGGKSLDEIVRTITSAVPLLPSRATIAHQQLKGDLDTIIMTALRTETERRYQSVDQFNDDIDRYLKKLPISARPNNYKYRASTFLKRHKFGVSAAALVLVTLIAGMIVSLWQARAASREKVKAEVVNRFLQGLLNASNPETNLSRRDGHDTTVKELLDEASARLETEDLSAQPEVRIELERIIGTSYLTQGQYELAEKHLNSVIESQTVLYGEDSTETLETMVIIADLWVQNGRLTEADNFYRRRLSALRGGVSKGGVSADFLFTALNDFALLRRAQGDSEEAGNLLREALDLRPQMSAEMNGPAGLAESVLALTLTDQGDFDEAENIVRSKLADIRRRSSSETSELCGTLTMFGSILMEKGSYEEAGKNLTEAETMYRKLFRPTFIPLGDNLRLQAQTLYFQNKIAEAKEKIDESLDIYRESSPQYINYPTALMIRGLILNKEGRSSEAETLLREAVKIRRKNLPADHFLTALAESALGECLVTEKRYAEAEPVLTQSYNNLRNSQGNQNPRTNLARERLARLYQDRKEP